MSSVATLVSLAVAPALVGASTLAAARWDERIGGIVSAFPAVVGPVLLIAFVQHGARFAADLAEGTLLGLVSLSCFVLVYGRAAPRFGSLPCLGLAWAAAAAAALLIRQTSVGSPAGLLVAAASLVLAYRLLPAGSGPAARRTVPRWELPARLALTAALVAGLAAAADRFGPLAGGILAALPVLASVLAVTTHRLNGPAAVLELLRGMLAGMSGFVVFCQIVVLLAVPAGGVATFALATAVALAVQAALAMRADLDAGGPVVSASRDLAGRSRSRHPA
jgi:hypothetical protein